MPLSIALILGGAAGVADSCGASSSPSNFDYLVLASMPDAQRAISVAGYRPAPRQLLQKYPCNSNSTSC
jgi:hypothetical protein